MNKLFFTLALLASASATVVVKADTQSSNSYLVKLGGNLLTDSHTKDVTGKTWYSAGLEYDTASVSGDSSSSDFGYFDYAGSKHNFNNGQGSSDATSSYYGIGIGTKSSLSKSSTSSNVKLKLKTSSLSLSYYAGAGVGYYVNQEKYESSTYSKKGLGGKIFVGATVSNNFLAELSYTTLPTINTGASVLGDLKASNIGLQVGFKF
jgi:hypothetical protein